MLGQILIGSRTKRLCFRFSRRARITGLATPCTSHYTDGLFMPVSGRRSGFPSQLRQPIAAAIQNLRYTLMIRASQKRLDRRIHIGDTVSESWLFLAVRTQRIMRVLYCRCYKVPRRILPGGYCPTLKIKI
jgi:hypothetical protein